jgi:hypothetical protein
MERGDIKVNVTEFGCEEIDWIRLAEGNIQGQGILHEILYLATDF